MASNANTHQQGNVKDPEHDGRLKENREAGRTKGTTGASAARAEGHPHEAHDGGSQGSKAGQSGSHEAKASHEAKGAHEAKGQQPKDAGGSDDLKSREYTDAQGQVHHHTRSHS